MEKLPFCKSVLESTWLYHEIGRCHLELKYYQDAKEFGQKSLAAAEQADDKVWQLNATVLVGQAEGKFQSEINLGGVVGGVLPSISHIGMCRPKGYGFWAHMPILVWNRVLFSRELQESMNVVIISIPSNKIEICKFKMHLKNYFVCALI